MENNTNGKTPLASRAEITEEERRLLINNYFKVNKVKLPSFTQGKILFVYLGVFLGILLMIYLKNAVPTIIFSGACFVFAFWHFYKFMTPYFQIKRLLAERPTEEQMLSWLIKDFKNTVKPRSIVTLGLNMSDVKPENFIIIPVPIFWEAPGMNSEEIMRTGLSDGTFLYTAWRVQILVLTKHYISLFKCNYNWLSNSMSAVSTNEFYFNDITSIRNDVRQIEYNFINNAEQPIGTGKVFCVTNFSGEYLTVINEIPSLGNPKVLSVNLEYIVSLLRMILRNRRFNINHEEEPPHTDTPQGTEDPQAKAEATRDEKIETINSIDYLLRNNTTDEQRPASQFADNTQSTSFDNDGDGLDAGIDAGAAGE
ncbi:MAG: hypothetical protein IKQ46_08440 [Bacteroidales bacterium]|nr:hypothetical protein [Bacteroidales bacterium]